MKTRLLPMLLFLAGKSFGQPIELQNPSFEIDQSECCTTPSGWYDCGGPKETPPDIQPGFFGVDLPATDGLHYVSLVVRENGTTEAIGQELSKPLEKDSAYLLTLFVARSGKMVSPTKNLVWLVNDYATPAGLRVWGGNTACDKKQLLAESFMIVDTQWAQMEFVLQPATRMTHIFLEACHKTPNLAYNGNVLIDNLSLSRIP